MKRVISVILALILVVSCGPVMKLEAGAETADVKTLVEEQIKAYADSINQPNAAKTAATALLTNAAFRGKDLSFDESSATTAMIFNSYLFQDALINSAVTMARLMQQMKSDVLICRGMVEWRAESAAFSLHAYRDGDDPEKDMLQLAAGTTPLYGDQTYLVNKYNACDKMLISTVGGMSLEYTITIAEIREDTVVYGIQLKCEDCFDYNADYSGSDYNRDYEELLSMFGGLTLREFYWESNVSFQLEVPYTCNHSSGDYRWEFDGVGDLASVTENGNTRNSLDKLQGTTEDGVFSNTIYTLQTPIRLNHDRSWSMEICCTGTGFLVFGEQRSGGVYLRKAANTLFFGESVYLSEDDEKKTLTHYGVWFTGKTGLSSADTHTYLLSNRVFADGTNMVYLSIDGMDLGPMNQYYHSGTSQHTTRDWVTGKDFVFLFIGTGTYPISDMKVDYIQVWENGMEGEPYSYFSEEIVAPTCSEQGYTVHTCTKCGYFYKTDFAEVLPHDYRDEVVVPSCTAEGYTSHTCTTCGYSYNTNIVEMVPHSYDNYVSNNDATCAHDGTKTGRCTVCGATDTIVDEGSALAHTWVEATCVAAKTCRVCGGTEGEALGHDLKFYNAKAPSCTELGWEAYEKCQRCRHSTFATIPALGHNYVDGVCLNCGDGAVLLGDVNGDGEIDIFDANLIVGYYNGTAELTEEQLRAADVNGDGEIDIFDANLVVSFYNGTIDKFPAE